MENDHIKKLYRSKHDRMIFGVCGGLGEYFGVDSLVFRALFLLLSFGGGAGVLVYLLMAILIPNEPLSYSEHHQAHGDHRETINEFAQQVKTGAQHLAQEMKSTTSHSGRRSLVGLLIVVFGCVLLLNVFMPQHWFRWDIFWPVVLILVGLVVIAKRS